MTTRTIWATLWATTCLWPVLALADGPLPTDPIIVSGDITVTTPSAAQMLVMQNGAYGIVDWGSFSVDQGFSVQFQNGTGATLNRVTGSDLSSIMGRLDATGSVYLINQNGIVFGAGGIVNTGGTFVASTLDIENGDFLDGGDATFLGDSAGYVINLGAISALGGDVAILARNVVNEGTVSAPNGTVGLVAGREVLMRDASVGDGMFAVRIGGDDTSVSESGAIRAAAAELRANGGNVYALAGNTGGAIAATGVARVNGRVFLTAGPSGSVKVDKMVKATGANGNGGTVIVDGGTVDVAGILDASGSTTGGEVRITANMATVFSGRVLAFGDGTAGSGGFAEVSGRHLTFGGTIETGGGTVLIDPDNIEITATSPLLAGASILTPDSIVVLLGTQDVVIQTSSDGTAAGTIVVSEGVFWSTPFSLSFVAHGDVWFNASVQNSSDRGGDLNVVAGWDGVSGLDASSTPERFDAGPFLSADLGSQTLFGNKIGASYTLAGDSIDALGNVYGRQVSDFRVTAVGSRAGATRVFANDVLFGGSGAGFTQLGYNTQTGGSGIVIDGDILVRSSGQVWLFGGDAGGSAAQIGHGGAYFLDSATPSVELGGTITVEAVSDIRLDGGAATDSYAMIGHGSRDLNSGLRASGARSGDIIVTSLNDISIVNGAGGDSSAAWIGHATSSGSILNADINLTAAHFDQAASDAVAGGTSVLDIVMLAAATEGGAVTVVATDAMAGATLSLTGATGSPSCECLSVDTLGNLVIQAGGDLSLDSGFGFSNTGGGNIALAAGRNFLNNAGDDAFGTMKGFWRVFSTRPDENTGDIGVLPSHFVVTEVVFDPANPFGLPRGMLLTGNGAAYAKVPLVTVGDATMTYGGSLVLPEAVVTVDGLVVDPLDWGFSIDGTFVNDEFVTFSATGNINAGVHDAALGFNWSTIPTVNGYDFLFFGNGDLTVDRAVLTGSIIGTPTKVYDGTADAALTSSDFLLAGFVSGEGGTVTQTAGTYASANAGDAVGVAANLTVDDVAGDSATDMANYVLPGVVSGTGAITRASLTATLIGPLNKVYDGTNIAALTGGNFQLLGFAGSEGATVTLDQGFYRGSFVNAEIGVDAELNGTDFVPTGATLLANYFLPTSATGNGAITPATLTVAVIGTPTKVYDGTDLATLTDGNYALTGFADGEGGTVAATSGIYASANASGSNLVTVILTADDILVTDSATSLSNYILPTTATGDGAITQATLTGAIIGTPTKVYDGTGQANLTADNFLLEGFVGDEGATVTSGTGTYSSVNASGSTTVTATLTEADFAGAGDTLMANYVLPTVVSGAGAITQAVLTGLVIGTPTKTYDGTTLATLTPANFQLDGFVTGEGATVTQAVGSYASANASANNLVTVALAADDFAGTGATVLGNYVLPTTVTGNGAITQGVLVAGVVIGTPTKVYDGTTTATLTAGNFLLSGFVAGEGAAVTQTAGDYATANASGSNLVTVTLTADDFAAFEGTLLGNYVLPTTVVGNGAISQATLTGTIIGTPTKSYDGTTTATLTSANFALNGFVAGEGATVTETAGTYGSANAAATNLVTVALDAGEFAATGGTLLSNYVLPTSVVGNGAIDRAVVSASIIGLPTKPFDGTVVATLTPANFGLIGFAVGEGATVTQTAGSFASATASVANTVTADLAAGDFIADDGTLLANYILPTTATGPALVDFAPPTQPDIPVTRGLDVFDTTTLGEPSGPATGIEVINTETTQRILDEISAGSAFCKALIRQEYVIDCLSDRLQSVADGLSAVGEYSEVRAALEDAAQQLHALALANASAELAQQVVRAGSRRSSRPLTAIAPEAMGAVNARAAAIIESAGLVLLRSSSGSAQRSVAFNQVAQVVNSTKVLLRSS